MQRLGLYLELALIKIETLRYKYLTCSRIQDTSTGVKPSIKKYPLYNKDTSCTCTSVLKYPYLQYQKLMGYFGFVWWWGIIGNFWPELSFDLLLQSANISFVPETW